jgi:hypothetical protein
MIARARWSGASTGRWHRLAGAAFAAALVAAGGQSGAGHSVGHFPSYYPDEIRIDVTAPEAAGKGLADASMHAYVGGRPRFFGPVPAHVKSLKSLGSLLVLSLDKSSPRFQSTEARCAAVGGILAKLRDGKDAGFVFHPYPVTPYHADYLHHVDLVEAAVAAVGADSLAGALPEVRLGAKGVLAQAIVEAKLGGVALAADAVLEVVPIDELVTQASVQFSGWTGPPWIKEGWFQAWHVLAPSLDAEGRAVAEKAYDRLIHGELRGGLVERINLERSLVLALGRGCARVVVGYAEREEFFNEAYPQGVENIAHDAIAGFNAPVFIRTVKLKEYPWNGKLHLGVPAASKSAWNPVGGFTDATARLMWAAVADPAMIPFPFNASWMPNRVQSELAKVAGRSGGIKVPADALRPRAGSGELERVGDWAAASEKVTYEVLPSPFDDGSEQGVADLLYPYVFAWRWGDEANRGANAYDPSVAAALAPVRERLAGIKVVRVDSTKHAIAEGMELVVKTPVVEVYLSAAPGDERQVANLAPPWSTVPWHLLALMEEAVARGWAAFSAEEAARRKVPWLDLVRDRALVAKLQELVTQFERERWRPPALKELVTAEEAKARWRSLGAFAGKNGHFLVANGPYRLKSWTPDTIVLEAVREMTYPLGFGTFDRFVFPPRAEIEQVVQEGRSVKVRASAAMTLKGGRGYTAVREPLLHSTARGVYPLLVVSRYLLIDAAGKVVGIDKMRWAEDGHFAIDLAPRLPSGDYTVIAGIFLDGNAVQPSARVLRVHIEG